MSRDTSVRRVADLRGVGPLLLMGAGTVALAVLVQRYEPPLVLGGLLLAAGAGVFLRWPYVATGLTAFLLYVNFPAMLTKQLGAPAAAAGAFLLLLAFPLMHLLLGGRERLRTDATFGLMVAYLAVLSIGALSAVDRSVAFARMLQFGMEGLLVYWLFTNVIRSRQTLRRVVLMVLAAGALTSSLSLYQEVTGSYDQSFGGLAYRKSTTIAVDEDVDVAVTSRSGLRAQGPTDEPNRFAQILIVLLPLAVLSHYAAGSAGMRRYAMAAGLLILVGIGLTLSRGAFLNVLVMALIMAALRWIQPRHLAGALLAVVLIVPVLSPKAVPRLLSISNAKYLAADDPATRAAADGAIRGRMTSMLTALHVFRDHPWIGVGPGQFRFYYEAYSHNPDIRFRAIEGTRRAHNLYLEIAAETGVAGLLVFLAIPLALMRRLWWFRRTASDGAARDIATAFLLSLLAYLGTGVFLHLSYQRYYWFLIALAGAAVRILRVDSAPAPAQPQSTATHAGGKHAWAVT